MEILDSFDDIRPYTHTEAEAAIQRVADHPLFPDILTFLFPDQPFEEFQQRLRRLRTTEDFQLEVMHPAIWSIVEKTTSALGYQGFEQLKKDDNYLFISNHRDILLDSAILQLLLHQYGLPTSEITFGNNLMKGDLVIDIGKLNKMFKIIREGNFREFYRNIARFSVYIRYTITKKGESIWIAQRNGRTKDGADATETAVLKMFSLSSSQPFVENLAELNITPTSISYEFEPCDFLKTREIYVSRRVKYLKAPDEDLNSILHGITQWKGGIHLAITPTITRDELTTCEQSPEKFKMLTQLVDQRIYSHYKLWPNNYIAYDLRTKSNQNSSQYSAEQKEYFIEYMTKGLENLEGDKEELQEIFLSIYANPVVIVN
ncbi:MAG: acyltransferase [Bacteroidales bacterium]|jgi:hypothetical protein|nr:acyltransferase [Bacteroidales bacterium]